MKSRRYTPLLAALAAFCVGLAEPRPAAAQRLHSLIVTDVTPGARWGIHRPNLDADAGNMYQFLVENAPPEKLDAQFYYMMDDEQATPQSVLEALDQLQPGPNDTVFFYYTGHGGIDDRGSYFDMIGGRLYRDEVFALMKSKGPRLAALISDCCNARDDGQAQIQARAPAPDIPEDFTPLFRSLLIEPSGVIDVNACAPGQSAFFAPPPRDEDDDPEGSLFTTALVKWADEHRRKRVSWDQLLDEVGMRTHLAFRRNYPDGVAFAKSKGAGVQRDQNVYAPEYPGKPAARGPRAGIAVRDDDGQGAVITEIVPDSPAARAFDIEAEQYVSLRTGMRITVMNGRPVTSVADFDKALDESSQILRLTVETDAGGQVYLVRLRY